MNDNTLFDKERLFKSATDRFYGEPRKVVHLTDNELKLAKDFYLIGLADGCDMGKLKAIGAVTNALLGVKESMND